MKEKRDAPKAPDEKPAAARAINCGDDILTRDEERDILVGIVRSQLVAMYELTGSTLALIGLLVPTRDASEGVQEKLERAAEKAGLAVDRTTGAVTRQGAEPGPVFGRATSGDASPERHESRGS